jgi:hypothetical protein
MALVRVLAVFACTLALAHPAHAACDIEGLMAEIQTKVPDGQQPDETWFNLYSQQFKSFMEAMNGGDKDAACEKLQDLSDWVDRNPPPK